MKHSDCSFKGHDLFRQARWCGARAWNLESETCTEILPMLLKSWRGKKKKHHLISPSISFFIWEVESIIQLLHRVVESISQSESECRSVVSNSLWPNGPQAARLLSPWNSPGQNPRGGSLSLIQPIFPTKGLNPGLLHCWWILYQLSHQGSPRRLEWVAYPFSSRSFWPGNQTSISCIAGRFFTSWATR